MSQTYKIHRWDAVLFGNSTDPTPIIYIEPNDTLLEFAKKNKNTLLVELQTHGSIYDKKLVRGVWAKSSEIPNCRENFFEKTGLYVIVLQTPWHGYPDFLGDVAIYGLTGEVPVSSENQTPDVPPEAPVQRRSELREPTENIEQYRSKGGLPVSGIVGMFAGFFVLLFIVLFVQKSK